MAAPTCIADSTADRASAPAADWLVYRNINKTALRFESLQERVQRMPGTRLVWSGEGEPRILS